MNQIIAIGEGTSALDSMLCKALPYHAKMVAYLVDGLTSLMAPIIISFHGVVIGELTIAL